eukprot:scaffold1058_cov163-Amphora_coffeaeformis.AAC.3
MTRLALRKKVYICGVCFGILAFLVTGSSLLLASLKFDSVPSEYVLEELNRTIGLENLRNPLANESFTLSKKISPKNVSSVPLSTLAKDCFPFNSQGWLLSGTRLETADGDFLDDVFQSFLPSNAALQGNIAPYQFALDQTICLDGSPFREGWKVSDEDNSDSIRFWTTRLIYLAIAYHQHRPAFNEYQYRKSAPSSCVVSRRDYKLSENDYECPSAKFLVFSLNEKGLGVNMKMGALMALRVAIATDRMLLLVNGLEGVGSPWQLVSCARKDFQCFFLPLSPCVPTKEELQRAPQLNANKIVRKKGNFSGYMQHERVLIFPPNHPTNEPLSFRQRLVDMCRELIGKGIIPDTPVVHKAMARLLDTTYTNRTKGTVADYELGGGILSYLMRPRPEFLQVLQKIQQSLSTQIEAESYPTMGLPIRASDKCQREAECFTFEKYVHAAQSLWLHKWPDTLQKQSMIPILITTESTSVSKDVLAFSGRNSSAPWQTLQFKFLQNTFDIQQDTGLMGIRPNKSKTLEQIMLSSLSSLRAQLSNRLLMLNCCSNFHYLMHMMAESGCGQRWDTEAICLRDHPVDDFRLLPLLSRHKSRESPSITPTMSPAADTQNMMDDPTAAIYVSDEKSTNVAINMEMTLPRCELPPKAVYEPAESVVAAAVEAQHLLPKDSIPPMVDAYKGLIDTLRSKRDLEMMRFVLLALRTSGKGKTLTYLTQEAKTKHAHLIHLIVRLNPYELNVDGATKADYALADAQLHLLMAIVSSNSVFLVPTLNSLWKSLTVKLDNAPAERTDRLHAALATLLRLVPKAKTELYPIIHANAPFRTRPAFRGLKYMPSIEAQLLELAIDRCLEIDVEIKISDGGQAAIEQEEEEDDKNDDTMGIFELEMDTPPKTKQEKLQADVTVDEMANKLDAMMFLLLQHIQRSSNLSSLFQTLLDVFECSILITHKSKFVQFLMFFVCGEDQRRQTNDDEDLNEFDHDFCYKLVEVLLDEFRSVVTRQTAACYLASFVSRAVYCDSFAVCQAVAALLRFAEAYIEAMGNQKFTAMDAREQCNSHPLFYTVAQAAFYIMCFRGREASAYYKTEASAGNPEIDIGAHRWERLCKHELNPLKYCLESVRVEFLQLAEAEQWLSDNVRQSIISQSMKVTSPKRKRKSLISTPATLERERLKGGVGGLGQGSNPLDSFFPFDPYLLRHSHDFIEPFYRHWQDSSVAILHSEEEVEDANVEGDEASQEENDEDELAADDDNEDELTSMGEDTASNHAMSYTSKVSAFGDASPRIQFELGPIGDW